MKRVLRLPAYRRLLAAYTLNELAWGIGSLALAVLVYDRTGSALAAAGYFLCAMCGPALISPAIVARLDQRASRPVLVALYGMEAVTFAILAWVAGRFALAAVLLLTLADGVLAVTARALARTATVAVTSDAGLLREGNAVTNASFSICYMVGPALGGVAVALGGVATALLITSGSFVAMTLTLATAHGLPGSPSKRRPTIGRLRSALRYARREPIVRILLSLLMAAMLLLTIPTPAEVVLAVHTLHGGAGGYGALLSAWGAGAVIGSAIYGRWRELPSRTLITLAIAAMGTGFAVMAIAPVLGIACAGAAIAGIGNGTMFVSIRTELQERVDGSWMALMMSLTESIIQGVPAGGILLGGALTAAFGPRAAIAVGGLGALVTAGAVWVSLQRGSAAVLPGPRGADESSVDTSKPAPVTS